MAGSLICFDLSLPHYLSYTPAPGVEARPMIPHKVVRALYMRGGFGGKPNGQMRRKDGLNPSEEFSQ